MSSKATPERWLWLFVAIGLVGGGPVQAQPGAGAKIPLFTLPELYAAFEVTDEFVGEASIPFRVIGEGVSLILNAKFLFGPFDIPEYGVSVLPFGGAGASLSFFQGQFVYSFHVLGGLEHRPKNSSFRLFAEFSVAFFGSPFIYSPAEGVSFGVRYAF